MKQCFCVLRMVLTQEQRQTIEALYDVEVACGPDACTIFFPHANQRKAARTIASIYRLVSKELEQQP
jgi:hypothetical protein